jgi:type IV pilus assembly protein PilF
MSRNLLYSPPLSDLTGRLIKSHVFIIVILLSLLSACASNPSSLNQPKLESKAQLKKSDKAMIHTRLAQEYMSKNQLGTAKSELEAALRINRNHSYSNYVMALLMMKFQQYGKAELYFKRSVESDPENSQAAHDFGMLLCQINQERE